MSTNQSNDTTPNRFKLSYWHVIVAVLAITMVGPIVSSLLTAPPTDYSYSEFKSTVARGAVQSVEITPERIDGSLADGTAFGTVRVDDHSLIELLEAQQVNLRGRAPSSWFGWILPIGLILGFVPGLQESYRL